MNKIMMKTLQGSVVSQTALGGLTIRPQLQISYNARAPNITKIGW